GFEGRALFVEAPGEARRFDVASAAEDLGSRTAPAPTLEARRFVEYLFRRGRVDLGAHGRAETRVVHPFARKTHELVPQAEDFALVRRTSTAASTRCREGTRRGRKPAGVAYRHEEASEEGQGPQASAPSHAGARAVHRGERDREAGGRALRQGRAGAWRGGEGGQGQAPSRRHPRN